MAGTMRKVFFSYLLLLLVLFSLSVSFVSAETTKELFDDWVPYKDTVTKDGLVIDVRTINGEQGNSADNILFLFLIDGKPSVSMNIGDCERLEVYEFCVDKISYSAEDEASIDRDGLVQPGVAFRLLKHVPEQGIKITNTMPVKLFNFDEEVDASIEIENEGDDDLTNLRLYQPIPEGFEITNIPSSFTVENNTILGVFNLFSENTKTFTYRITSKNYPTESESFKTKIIYNSPYQNDVEKLSSSVKLRVDKPFTYTIDKPKDILDIGSSFEIEFDIDNKESESQIIQLTMVLPTSVSLEGYYSTKKEELYQQTISIDPDESDLLTFRGLLIDATDVSFKITKSPTYT